MKVVKLGGSVITDKSVPFSVRKDVIARLAEELSKHLRSGGDTVVLVHGGGSYGHPMVKKCLELEGRISDWCFTRVAYCMEELNAIVLRELLVKGVRAVSLPPHSICEVSGGEFQCALSNAVALAKRGMTPVLYGDVVPDVHGGYRVISGDDLAWLVAKEMHADVVVFLTNVDGVYLQDPRHGNLRLLKSVRLAELIRGGFLGSAGRIADVTGGMRGKFESAVRVGVKGVKAVVTNGLVPGNLLRALRGEEVGTVVWV